MADAIESVRPAEIGEGSMAPPQRRVARDRITVGTFAASMFLSACLLFSVQPLFAKMALPKLGGAPGVWAVALVFFQSALLVGYAYAHGLARLASMRLQVLAHAAVLVATGLCLPLSLSQAMGEPGSAPPGTWLLALLTASVGAPFAALSATAPLLQSWYARTAQSDAKDPYYLYVASNLGSLLALVAYPAVIEPFAAVSQQTAWWSAGYLIAGMAIVMCALLTLHLDQGRPLFAPRDRHMHSGATVWRERFIWLALAAIPSALLVGVTTYITTDVASAPFLWIPPLALYLITFIIAFSRKPLIQRDSASRALTMLAPGSMPLIILGQLPLAVEILLALFACFFGGLVCHQALAERRPPASRLTEFYLFLSLGGAIGGLSSALIAPVVFDRALEFPLALALATLASVSIGGSQVAKTRGFLLMIVAIPTAVVLGSRLVGFEVTPRLVAWLSIFAGFVALGLRDRPLVFAACTMLIFLTNAGLHLQTGTVDFMDRSFFGTVLVETNKGLMRRFLLHGTTLHGMQSLKRGEERRPIGYYTAEGPIGQAILQLQERGPTSDVGVVGLGAGGLACYQRGNERWTYFEIDPMVVKVAADPRQFTFLLNCAPNARFVIGDGRLTLAQEPAGKFDLLVLDAFSSDVVPAHLLTQEAVRLFVSRLKPGGVLIFHISTRHLDLKSVLARVVGAERLAMRFRSHPVDARTLETFDAFSSEVMLIAADESALSAFTDEMQWAKVVPPAGRPWTDDYTNILGALLERLFTKR